MTVALYRGPYAQQQALEAIGAKPFSLRAPHYSSSYRSILGALSERDGELIYTPGEIGLATNGTLLLTDLPEFPRDIIESIGRAMQSERLVLCNGRHQLRIPVRFSVVATAHYCPCGYEPCRCSKESRARFDRKLRWAMTALRGPVVLAGGAS